MSNYKIPFKEMCGLYVFATLFMGLLTWMMYYTEQETHKTTGMYFLPIVGWIICTGYLLSHTKFKR